ncbi:MAG: ABC transporter permease [Rubrivivax sp.]|nr:ABC transporter permease [Rubrivivax sp.]
MSAVLPATAANPLDDAQQKSEGVWHAAWARFRQDRVGFWSMTVMFAFLLLILLSATGLVAGKWQDEVGVPSAPPTFMGPAPPQAGTGAIEQPKGPNVDLSDIDPLAPRYKEWDEKAKQFQTAETPKRETLPFGADRLGRDVLSKAIKGTEISVFVGVVAAIAATTLGTLLGALGGFFGGRVGDGLEWLYNVFESIPNILLIFAFAAALNTRGVETVVIILALTGWTGMYRQVRAEFMKHRGREYVRAAEAIGASTGSRMFRHILPNVSHVILVRMGLLVVGFIKAEVILSYLGIGVRVDQVSWGTMLADSQSELILGHWWQLAAATLFMAVFVTAFSLMADAWRDALDPKLRGLEK